MPRLVELTERQLSMLIAMIGIVHAERHRDYDALTLLMPRWVAGAYSCDELDTCVDALVEAWLPSGSNRCRGN